MRGLTGQAHFSERYDKKVGVAAIQHWPGSETEYDTSYPTYGLELALGKGQTRTVVTGADFTYAITPTAQGRFALGSIPLQQNQDSYSYSNEQDVVCELAILIESSSEPIYPLQEQQSAVRVDDKGALSRSAVHFVSDEPPGKRSTISARWSKLMPNEKVGIIFRW
jgi:hypothetical protein